MRKEKESMLSKKRVENIHTSLSLIGNLRENSNSDVNDCGLSFSSFLRVQVRCIKKCSYTDVEFFVNMLNATPKLITNLFEQTTFFIHKNKHKNVLNRICSFVMMRNFKISAKYL